MLTLYYLVFFGLMVISFLLLFNYRKVDDFTQRLKRKELTYDDLTPTQMLAVISSVFALFWYLFGLLTPQWGFFIVYLGISLPVALVTKRFWITRLLHSIAGFGFQLFMVINYFHLHLTTADLLIRP